MNDQELIRKAVQEVVEEYDVEKWKPITTALKYGSKLVPKSWKQGFTGKAPTGKPATGQPKTSYSSDRMRDQYGPVQPSAGQKFGQNVKTVTQVPGKVVGAVKTAPSKIKAVPSKIKANPKTTAKVVAGTAAATGAATAAAATASAAATATATATATGTTFFLTCTGTGTGAATATGTGTGTVPTVR